MACTTITGITKSCDNNMGGIQKLYLWDMEDVDPLISNFDPTTYFWLAYDIAGGVPLANVPVAFEFTRNNSGFTEETNIDLSNGSTYVTTTLNMIFTRREAAKSAKIKILAEGQRYLGALIQDSNNLWWLVENLQLSATGEGSGVAKADGSKYSVTLLAENLNLMGGVSPANAADFITDGLF
jgi:hypothetical protein